MKLTRRAARKASDCLPDPEALPPMPGDIPCHRVCLLVEDITAAHQQQLYALLVRWDSFRYAEGWAIPVNLVKRFRADFNDVSKEVI